MIPSRPILNQMRSRIVREAAILPDEDIQLENELISTSGKKLWISEYFIGGEDEAASNISTRQSAIVEYDIHIPVGRGTTTADEVANDIMNEFNPVDPQRNRVAVPAYPNVDINVIRTGVASARTESGVWYILPVLIYLEITDSR